MAFTQDDLDNINETIAAGELETLINGKRVVYRSFDELLKIRALIEADIAAAAGTPRRIRGVRVNVTKGA